MSCLKKRRGKKESRTKSTENMSCSYRILLGPDVTGKNHPTKPNTAHPGSKPPAQGTRVFLPALPHPRGKQNAQTSARPRAIPKPELRSHTLSAESLGRIGGNALRTTARQTAGKSWGKKSSPRPVDHVRKSNAETSGSHPSRASPHLRILCFYQNFGIVRL